MPSEPEGVAHHGLKLHLSGNVGGIVQVALRVRVLQIDGGGMIPFCRATTLIAASKAAPAPSMCPVMDLVELMGTRCAWSPNTALRAMVSNLSFIGVDVPWALT